MDETSAHDLETLRRFEVYASPWNDAEGAALVLSCSRCPWTWEVEQPIAGSPLVTLADLLATAFRHTEQVNHDPEAARGSQP